MTTVHGFKYGNGAQAVVDLVKGIDQDAAADGLHVNKLGQFNPVVVVAQHEGVTYAAVGMATGNIHDTLSEAIWPNWVANKAVHGVDFINRVFVLDREYDLGRQSLPLETAIEIARWAFAQ